MTLALPLVLKRFDIRVLKDRTPSNNEQVPAASVTVDFYAQGATVKTATTIFVGTAVQVFHLGSFQASDFNAVLLVRGSIPARITGVDPASNTIALSRISGNPNIPVAVGDRLVRSSAGRPLVYADPTGDVSTGGSALTTLPDGRAVGYLRDRRYDYVVRVGIADNPHDTRVFPDAEGSFVIS